MTKPKSSGPMTFGEALAKLDSPILRASLSALGTKPILPPESDKDGIYRLALVDNKPVIQKHVANNEWVLAPLGQAKESRAGLDDRKRMQKPRIFIGSSVEGLPVAEHIQLGLDHHAECTVWSQGVFGLSSGTLDSLLQAIGDYEFGVLVLTPDDMVQKRDTTRNAPRDNVLFELGLFMGALGRERTYIVYCRDEKPDLPTDLAGVTAATFARRSDGNLQAALGPVCTQIKAAIHAAKRAPADP